MAIDTKILPVAAPVSASLPAIQLERCQTQDSVSGAASLAEDVSDFFLLRNSVDASWTEKLAEQLQGLRIGNHGLKLTLTDWNSARDVNWLIEMAKHLRNGCHLGIILSGAMLREDWSSAQKTIVFLRELASEEQCICAILKENVSIPPVLRLGAWFDFRNEKYFDESVADLMSLFSADFGASENRPVRSSASRSDATIRPVRGGSLYACGISSVKERILSNLLPVAELPKFVYSAETRFRTESELTEACGGPGPSPCLLKGSRIYTIESLSQGSIFTSALKNCEAPTREDFRQWLYRSDRAGWAAELLNNLFRHHAWKRGLRFEQSTGQYYFPRTKPKSVWWEISEQTVSREVTAPHIGWIDLGNHIRAEVQYGWKHQSIRADFVQVQSRLFLRLQPGWLLTELDGKTPATTQPVGPVFSSSPQQQRNGQVLRSLRFWSVVLAKGHHEIRIGTGQSPVRIKLTPLSGFTQFGIPSDQMDYDQLVLSEMEDDLLIPALGTRAQGSKLSDEEVLSSQTLGNPGSGQSQAHI